MWAKRKNPRTACIILDRHGVHFLTAYVAGA